MNELTVRSEPVLRAAQDRLRKVVADCLLGVRCPCHHDAWDQLEIVEFLLGETITPQRPTFEDAVAELRHALAHPEQVFYLAPEFAQLILDRIDGEATSGNADLPKPLR